MTPNIWELYDGMESKGFVKNFKNDESVPPKYKVVGHPDLDRTVLPKGSVIQMHTIEDEFPLGLEGPEVHEILDTKEETIQTLYEKIQTLRDECGEMDIQIKQLQHELKHKKPGGSIRWKLTYTWCDNVTEVYWDFRTKKQAVAYMEDNIKGFFGIKVVESIKDVKYDKYIYGTRGVKQDETSITQKK